MSIQQSFAYVNARFFSLLDQVQAGTLGSVSILNTAGDGTVAKIVSESAFNAALVFGGTATRVVVPQLPYGMVPQRVGYNSLYKMVKQLRDDNAIMENAAKAFHTYSQTTKASLDLATKTTNVDTVIEATTGGVAGNSITVAFVGDSAPAGGITIARVGTDFTIHFEAGVSTVTNLETAITALAGADDLFGVKTPGTGAHVLAATVDEFTATHLAGGTYSDVTFTALASGINGNNMTIKLTNPGLTHTATTPVLTGVAVDVGLRYAAGNVAATFAEVAAAITALSSTLHMTALATGTTSAVISGSGLGTTHLAGGLAGTHNFVAYDVTRSFLPSRQQGLAPTAPVRAVMIPKVLADQLAL